MLWTTLASAHQILHELTNEPSQADHAITAFMHAAEAPGSPAQRAFAAYWAGKVAYSIGAHDRAANAFDTGVDLLPSIAWPGLSRASQEDALRRYQVLAGAAAAARVETGNALAAAAASERGRGVMWAASLSVRSDLSRLAATHSDLAATLTRLASHLIRADVGDRATLLP